jgi:hypothetical protein
MPKQNETPAQRGGAATGAKTKQNSIAKTTKKGRVLEALAEGRSLNRFQATRELHDWCLHSTVAALEKHGLSIARQYEQVPGYQGNRTHCVRYWLEPDQRERARELLGGQ